MSYKEGDIVKRIMVSFATLFVTLLFLLPSLLFVNAEIYKWIDEKGTVNFTEDPATIPEKYRDKAKSRTTEEDLMTLEERLQEKKRHEGEMKKRQEGQQIEYERSFKEERVRKQIKDREDARHEERLKAEKEEEARRLKESQKEPVPEKEPQKQRLVKCSNCTGGYIKCSWCNGKGGKYVKITISQMIYRECVHCSGTGRKECVVCGGKGLFLR